MSLSQELSLLNTETKVIYVERVDEFSNEYINFHLRESKIIKIQGKEHIELENGDIISYFQIKQFNNSYSYYYYYDKKYVDYMFYNLIKIKKKFLNN